MYMNNIILLRNEGSGFIYFPPPPPEMSGVATCSEGNHPAIFHLAPVGGEPVKAVKYKLKPSI